MSYDPGQQIGIGVVKFTAEGGVAVRLINETGAASVKGSLVKADSAVDNAFILTGAGDPECFGAVYENAIADGSLCWVIIAGIAEVLLKDATAATRGNWVSTSDTAGRSDATNAAPPGGGVVELDNHMQEIGHCIESKAAGNDVLAKCIIHFN